MFAESQIGRSSFQKLLEPKPTQKSGIAPYRIVLGNIKDKVLFICFEYVKYVVIGYIAKLD